jgi:integrase
LITLALIQDDEGQPLTYSALRSRFDTAREAANVRFQFRDIRAESATDLENLAHVQKLLSHKTRAMTERCTRKRKGEKISPLK